MPDRTSDLRAMVIRYRDHLRSELSKVDQFLEMADHLAEASENLQSAFPINGEARSPDDEPLNLFTKTD